VLPEIVEWDVSAITLNGPVKAVLQTARERPSCLNATIVVASGMGSMEKRSSILAGAVLLVSL
jgi:hypothetical protein